MLRPLETLVAVGAESAGSGDLPSLPRLELESAATRSGMTAGRKTTPVAHSQKKALCRFICEAHKCQ